MWALGFEFSGFLLPTVLWLWVIKKESTVAWHWRVLFTYLTAKLVKIVSKKFFNLWKWSREGYAATEKTFIQENLLKLNKKSELVVFEPRLVLPTLTPQYLHVSRGRENAAYRPPATRSFADRGSAPVPWNHHCRLLQGATSWPLTLGQASSGRPGPL